VQRRHNCSPAASFANCITLYLLKVHLQTFLSIPIAKKKWQILSCDAFVANERCVCNLARYNHDIRIVQFVQLHYICPKIISIFSYNQQTDNQYHNSTYHSSLSVQSTLLHVSTLSCHHQTVYSQCLAKLHKPFKLQLLEIQFIKDYHFL